MKKHYIVPLHKTKELLKDLKLARKLEPNPIGIAMLYTINGMQECTKEGKLHPWTGIMMYARATGDEDATRELGVAMDAMKKMGEILMSKGDPDEFEKRLRDPKRSEQGYSIDAMMKKWWGAKEEDIREIIKAKLAPKKKEKKVKVHPLETIDAYILPDGKLVHVGFQGHIHYASTQNYHANEPETLGWVQISGGAVRLAPEVRPTTRQMKKLREWCEYHKKNFDSIEDFVSDTTYYGKLFFGRE